MLLAVTPLPRPLTTPPVTSTYFMAASSSVLGSARSFARTASEERSWQARYSIFIGYVLGWGSAKRRELERKVGGRGEGRGRSRRAQWLTAEGLAAAAEVTALGTERRAGGGR
ncbi:hypothetical protein GUJ93_ZPchr0001g31294 [Zizania palustris]|uniref:Uncharacterized protein n=1 Tax=Zizania palustris TaxID=103762 RepID=A0A8J5RVQ4_ZIZPA|nr:hypothetical protein GUJ93_ZPchr0001g31294 [Zizania palustris]